MKLYVVQLLIISSVFFVGFASHARTQCQTHWSYGYSGAFQCEKGYMGATRPCEELQYENGSWVTVDRWQEEGCATGVIGERGYCVRNCGGSRSSQTNQ